MDAIVTYDLTKEYGERLALGGLNLQVSQGQSFACVGGKSCGKTTLVRILTGLSRPTSGECSVMGLSPTYEPHKLHQVAGSVLSTSKLYANMTLWENLRFYASLHGMDDNDSLERSSFLLHKLDIWEGRDLRVDSLSTGVVRRASLARALMHSPKILLVDEPSGGLDQETSDAIQELLRCITTEEGITLFLCASTMAYAQLLCDQFAILQDGILLAKGDLESLRKDAGVLFRAQLRLGDGAASPTGFHQKGEFWEREIKSPSDMPKIIAQAVREGVPLYEARLLEPTLEEIYNAYLDGGRKKVMEFEQQGEEEPTDLLHSQTDGIQETGTEESYPVTEESWEDDAEEGREDL